MLYALAFIAVLGLTPLVRRYAIKKSLIDLPNQRSSHTVATPRGGGLAISVVWFAGLVYLACSHKIDFYLATALIAGGSLVALIGYLDDRYNLPARRRIVIQILGASIAIYYLDGLTQLNLGFTTLNLGSLGYLVGVLGIVWAINFYNFMDGIDGLAAGEAVFTSLAAGLPLYLNQASGLATICWLLAAVSAGFLFWNWSPAKIFMGDISSGLLGFNFAVLLIGSNNSKTLPIFSWFILLAIFIADTTFTLISRIWKKQKWYVAHRSHAYQRLIQAGYSHQSVTGGVLLVNCLALLPLAYLATGYPQLALMILIFVFLALFGLWLKICSGVPKG